MNDSTKALAAAAVVALVLLLLHGGADSPCKSSKALALEGSCGAFAYRLAVR